MIEVSAISVSTKGFSLNNITLNVQAGSCHCLVGPTGCGKTTLLEAILGLRKVQKGTILLDGKDITNKSLHDRGFSYVPQDLAIFPHLTVKENIFYGIRYGVVADKQKRYESALEMADSLGLSSILHRKATNLSGGECQRIALARALAPGREYILLDEPLSALHEGMKKELWLLLKELQKRYNLTILMVSHDMEETYFLADHITIMTNGQIQQTGHKDEVYHLPATLEVAEFFGIKNIFNAEIKARNENNCTVYCKELASELLLPVERLAKLNKTVRGFLFGIRAQDIMFLRPDAPKNAQNYIEGKITAIYHKGSSALVLFTPNGSNATMEIDLPSYALAKLRLRESIKATASLPMEHIFVLA